MDKRPIFALLAAGAITGWFAPEIRDSAGTFAVQSPDQPAAKASGGRLDVLQDDALGGEVVLPRAEDGHFYAEVTIDGASANMLVDTGASMIALTGADADSLGIYWDETAVRPVARGASGTVYGVPVTLETVQLGEIEARQVDAVVVPEGLEISLLGQSFLSRIPKVEMDQQRMVLGS